MELVSLRVGSISYLKLPSVWEHKRAKQKPDRPKEHRVTGRHGAHGLQTRACQPITITISTQHARCVCRVESPSDLVKIYSAPQGLVQNVHKALKNPLQELVSHRGAKTKQMKGSCRIVQKQMCHRDINIEDPTEDPGHGHNLYTNLAKRLNIRDHHTWGAAKERWSRNPPPS